LALKGREWVRDTNKSPLSAQRMGTENPGGGGNLKEKISHGVIIQKTQGGKKGLGKIFTGYAEILSSFKGEP